MFELSTGHCDKSIMRTPKCVVPALVNLVQTALLCFRVRESWSIFRNDDPGSFSALATVPVPYAITNGKRSKTARKRQFKRVTAVQVLSNVASSARRRVGDEEARKREITVPVEGKIDYQWAASTGLGKLDQPQS